jgi:hypothetical protein
VRPRAVFFHKGEKAAGESKPARQSLEMSFVDRPY